MGGSRLGETMKSAGRRTVFLCERFCKAAAFGPGVQMNFRFEAAADELRGAGLFEATSTAARTCASRSHFSAASLAIPQCKARPPPEQCHMHAFGFSRRLRQILPNSSEVNTSIGAAKSDQGGC